VIAMTYTVELRYIDGDLADLMREMRAWLDENRIEPQEFRHSSGPPGLAFRIAFRDPENAAGFAEAFGGRVECADPQGTGVRWTAPPLSRTPPRRHSIASGKPARSPR
jgi:hypothetical protein